MITLVFMGAALAISQAQASTSASCVSRWFASNGPAPEAPKLLPRASPEQKRVYESALVVYRPKARAYAAAAKLYGQRCILGDTNPRPTARDNAAQLLEHQLDDHTSFVAMPPADIADFCPGYFSATETQRVTFWRSFFLAIIPHESGFNNASLMLDGKQYSIGLYQVSLDNGCAVTREIELIDADKNTRCAVHIMTSLERPRRGAHGNALNVIGGDGASFRMGAAGYWSTLRARRVKRDGVIVGPRRAILNAVHDLPGCNLNARVTS